MFKPTTWVAIGGLVVFGLIVADFLRNPKGTRAIANGAVAISTPSIQGVSGQRVT